jgi:hypothetical protein
MAKRRPQAFAARHHETPDLCDRSNQILRHCAPPLFLSGQQGVEALIDAAGDPSKTRRWFGGHEERLGGLRHYCSHSRLVGQGRTASGIEILAFPCLRAAISKRAIWGTVSAARPTKTKRSSNESVPTSDHT